MKKPTVVSIVNHKGGVLKTTVTANLGAALALSGASVLVVDLDAQQNLTQSLLGQLPYVDGKPTLYDAIMEESSLDDLVQESSHKGLHVVPCQEDFVATELSLVNVVGREYMLKACFAATQRFGSYDYVLIDNPPAVSLVVMNALVASDCFLVPVSAEYLPMVGLTLLGNSIGKMQKLTPNLRPLGVILTKYARSERICRQVESMLRKDLGDMLFDTKIRVNTKAKSAPSVRKTIFEYEASRQGRGTQDFSSLAEEFLERLRGQVSVEGRVAANA